MIVIICPQPDSVDHTDQKNNPSILISVYQNFICIIIIIIVVYFWGELEIFRYGLSKESNSIIFEGRVVLEIQSLYDYKKLRDFLCDLYPRPQDRKNTFFKYITYCVFLYQ